jgi:aspartate aminotransferase
MISAFAKRREIIVNGLNEVLGFSCKKPDGAFYAFPSIKDVYSLSGWGNIEREYNE